jgi:hypothetical protein
MVTLVKRRMEESGVRSQDETKKNEKKYFGRGSAYNQMNPAIKRIMVQTVFHSGF